MEGLWITSIHGGLRGKHALSNYRNDWPASDAVDTLAEMIEAGMNIARLNYSHGDFQGKEQTIQNIRDAEGKRASTSVCSQTFQPNFG